jgi:hypothetical protein
MKKIIIICLVLGINIQTKAQIEMTKSEGSSVTTKLGYGIVVNNGSSLKREKIVLNDSNCPVQLNDVGIETIFSDKYSFNPTGFYTAKVPVVAVEVAHILYDVYGEHMKTIYNSEIKDIEGIHNLAKSGSWDATENNVSSYFICVSYVANVRTKNGQLWHYNFNAIKEQILQLKMEFNEAYLPKKVIEK